MQKRTWIFRLVGLACLVLGLAVAVAGVAAFPYNASPFLSRKGVGSSGEAAQYYAQIAAPATFAAWYAQYFPSYITTTVTYANARYYNAADLGFGREMHCREEVNFTSCYVVNHGLGAGAPVDLAVQDAVAGTRVLPTVAMVYDWTIDGQPNDVKFYVYDASGNRLNQVALDSEGAKNVPNLCLACHGGSYNSGTDSVTGANFLPFDAASFGYSETTPEYSRASQEEALRVLNAYVYNTSPNPKIKTLIDNWYGGVNAVHVPGAVLDDSFVPAAFSGNSVDTALYQDGARLYCRGCHVAQSVNLESPADFNSAFDAVFGANDMPHAQVTAHNFWSGPGAPAIARSFADTGQTFRVTTTADPAAPYVCDATCSLREAVLAANADPDLSIIVFDVDGNFTLSQAGDDDTAQLGDLDLTEDVLILGNGAAVTTIVGNGSDRVFHVLDGAEVLIQRVTIRGGVAGAPGGGGLLVDYNSKLTLNLSMVRNNQVPGGGFSGNGLALRSGATVQINQSTFTANTGIGPGGAILNDEGTLELFDSTLSGNSASDGAGIYSSYGALTTILRSTIVLNVASDNGGGIGTIGGGQVTIGSSIVSGNRAFGGRNCAVTSVYYASVGYNLVGENNTEGGCPHPGTDKLATGGLSSIVRLTLDTDLVTGLLVHRPTTGSPVVDAIPLGLDCSTPSYDERNLARPRDGDDRGGIGCDIGAVEKATHDTFVPISHR